jgi:hypothetical protein
MHARTRAMIGAGGGGARRSAADMGDFRFRSIPYRTVSDRDRESGWLAGVVAPAAGEEQGGFEDVLCSAQLECDEACSFVFSNFWGVFVFLGFGLWKSRQRGIGEGRISGCGRAGKGCGAECALAGSLKK